jgi:plastocyanin
MRPFMRHFSIALVLCTLVAACGGSSGSTSPIVTPVKTLGAVTVSSPTLNVSAGESSTIAPQSVDANSAALAGVTYTFVSSAPAVAEVSASGEVLALSAGSTTVTVTGSFSGVSKTAPVAVTVTGTLPTTANVAGGTSSFTFTPKRLAIKTGGTVNFSWGAINHNVTFDATTGAPAAIASGANVAQARTFSTAGNFTYECTIHAGMTGTVLVR